MMELYCPGFSFITASRVAGSVPFSPDSGTVPRSPPLPEVSGSSEYFIASVAKSSPLSRRLAIIWIFLRASPSFCALSFWLWACGFGDGVTMICAR